MSKNLAKNLAKNQGLNQIGQTYQRPWGTYKTLDQAEGFQIKIITVSPGGRLSLQSHEQRQEHWIVVSGLATITVNDSKKEYFPGSYIFIPLQAKHRLENFGADSVVLVEVQMGDYLGEDDIKRYDDIYGR
jgi:mannose-6-phosphate isomerase-like protein (cupin superfamily)